MTKKRIRKEGKKEMGGRRKTGKGI